MDSFSNSAWVSEPRRTGLRGSVRSSTEMVSTLETYAYGPVRANSIEIASVSGMPAICLTLSLVTDGISGRRRPRRRRADMTVVRQRRRRRGQGETGAQDDGGGAQAAAHPAGFAARGRTPARQASRIARER